MGANPDYVRKKFGPQKDKTLRNALAHRIGKEFPRIGGPRMLAACAEVVLEVVFEHLRPRDHVSHGQVVWMAVSVDDPPARGKRIANTDLVPLVLDLSTPQDIDARIARLSPDGLLEQKAIRLCRQAFEQKALLSNCDLAELLCNAEGRLARILASHERRTGKLVPRRATVHDVGTGLTHKRIICRKRILEGKDTHVVARETYHSQEAVDRYLGQYDRVRHCRLQGMPPQEIAYVLNCSRSLVEEFLALDTEIEGKT